MQPRVSSGASAALVATTSVLYQTMGILFVSTDVRNLLTHETRGTSLPQLLKGECACPALRSQVPLACVKNKLLSQKQSQQALAHSRVYAPHNGRDQTRWTETP